MSNNVAPVGSSSLPTCSLSPLEPEDTNDCHCHGCGRSFKLDLMIDDDLWDVIRPEGSTGSGGLLCGCCIVTRLEARGGYQVLYSSAKQPCDIGNVEMSDKAQQIQSIINNMPSNPTEYDAKARQIWNLLSPDEQQCLVWVFSRKPVWKGEISDDHVAYALLSYKLLTWNSHAGNEGYIVGTFVGYAAMKSNKNSAI